MCNKKKVDFEIIIVHKGGEKNGGDDRSRTGDLGVANAALSQLSYIPTKLFELYIKFHSYGQIKSLYDFMELPCRFQRDGLNLAKANSALAMYKL